MPRTALPPTPDSSTDIKGQDGTKHLAKLSMTFELPPPAAANMSPPPSSDLEPADDAADGQIIFPVQASEAVKSRPRSSTVQRPAKEHSDSFTLPPPPTRSRKIIQMKPKTAKSDEETVTGGPQAAEKSKGRNKTASQQQPDLAPSPPLHATGSGSGAGSGKKKSSATSAAGRKIARKTAHSLIERRRRSKMNEEFAVLKNMIPACTGEMHKLAILQASIEYVRYLEDCVSQLKVQRTQQPSFRPDSAGCSPTTPSVHAANRFDQPFQYHSESPDVDMIGSELPSPHLYASTGSHQSSISPALLPQGENQRHGSYSSTSTTLTTTDRRHYSFSQSATTSPAFGPQIGQPLVHDYTGRSSSSYSHSAAGSTLTSPALQPQADVDHEATAALLMLNSDRRGAGGHSASTPATARGISVRDLLST